MRIRGTKAYWVDLGEDDGQVMAFANSEEEIQSRYDALEIRREPRYDAHWQLGYVPPLSLVDAGWRFECDQCYREINDEYWDYNEDKAIEPKAKGRFIFCSDECLCQHNAEVRIRKIRVAQAKAFLLSRFPKAKDLSIHAWGDLVSATFRWADRTRTVSWDSRSPEVLDFGWENPSNFAETEKEFRQWANQGAIAS